MTTTAGILALIAESAQRDEVDRVAAAVGARVFHLDPESVPPQRTWLAAATVIVDADAARRCADAGLPRRAALFVCVAGEPDAATLQTAITVGAQDVLALPEKADTLVRAVSDVGDSAHPGTSGAVVAVIAGRGGAGASLFAAALAQQLPGPLLMDLDPWSGGIDLLLGGEHIPGLRWPDLSIGDGRLNWAAVRQALPQHRGIAVLSATRTRHEMSAGAVAAVLDASRRASVTAVCDLPRRLTDAVSTALADADLVVLVTAGDVRSCSSTTAIAPVLKAVNPNVGLVVRGPAPGGLRPGDIAEVTGLPLLASMRPEPMIAEKLERDGLRLRSRSPLAVAARRVAALLGGHPALGRAA